jgi:hypothetical protein
MYCIEKAPKLEGMRIPAIHYRPCNTEDIALLNPQKLLAMNPAKQAPCPSHACLPTNKHHKDHEGE